MAEAILHTNFTFPYQKDFRRGKVRDIYNCNDELLTIIVTDRISAFDVVLSRGIPYKGQVLNQIANEFLDATNDIVPNWKTSSPDPNATIGHFAKPFPVEFVVRGYLTGHAWREYNAGKRSISGVPLPDGMHKNEPFSEPILTPTTKAETGHDEDISREYILRNGLISEEAYNKMEHYVYELFKRGSEMAREKGLLLVDTKYEFGEKDGQIYLIDEIHTPDSSRYFYADEFEERFNKGLPQKQLSKEFVRQWLIEQGFQGEKGQQIPEMTDEFVNQVSDRYIELYEKLTGKSFKKDEGVNIYERIEKNVTGYLNRYFEKTG